MTFNHNADDLIEAIGLPKDRKEELTSILQGNYDPFLNPLHDILNKAFETKDVNAVNNAIKSIDTSAVPSPSEVVEITMDKFKPTNTTETVAVGIAVATASIAFKHALEDLASKAAMFVVKHSNTDDLIQQLLSSISSDDSENQDSKG